jgi:hypothetical protein
MLYYPIYSNYRGLSHRPWEILLTEQQGTTDDEMNIAFLWGFHHGEPAEMRLLTIEIDIY